MNKTKCAIVTVTLIALFLQGCAAINENVVRGVNAYCNEPYADRQLTRALINNALAESGHSVAVTCSGDPD